ncbi:hypothetical protein TYRP_016983 [Tyrophagus putrescentiae]|nr:hypothetical protein TYRP_016983 [Tyrophagus putrescentiae]
MCRMSAPLSISYSLLLHVTLTLAACTHSFVNPDSCHPLCTPSHMATSCLSLALSRPCTHILSCQLSFSLLTICPCAAQCSRPFHLAGALALKASLLFLSSTAPSRRTPSLPLFNRAKPPDSTLSQLNPRAPTEAVQL